jgi:hypothetical protein
MSSSETGGTPAEDQLLFRQVHPSFVREGRVGSQAFRPTPKDKKQLSVAQGSKTTSQAAFELHTQCNKFGSAGTWAVSTEECAALDLSVREDPITDVPCPDPAHAVVDFSVLSNSKIEAHGARLARQANERGRLYPPEAESDFGGLPEDSGGSRLE